MFRPWDIVKLAITFGIYWTGFEFVGPFGLAIVVGILYVLNALWLHRLGQKQRIVVAARAKNHGDWRVLYGELETVKSLMLFMANKQLKDTVAELVRQETIWLSQNKGRV